MRVPLEVKFDVCLKLAMAARSLNQVELAKRADLPPSHVNHYLCARRQPSLNNILRLCRALEMTPNELLMIEKMAYKKHLIPAWLPSGED